MNEAELLAGARALVRRWRPGVAYRLERKASGGSTPVFQITDQTGAAIGYLRLAEAPGEVRAAEVVVHRQLAVAGIRVPKILAWEPAPPELDRSAAWTSAMPGVPLAAIASDDAMAWSPAVRQAGHDLVRLNRVVVHGFGWVDRVAPTGDLIAAHDRRRDWTAEYAAALTTVMSQRLLPGPALDALHAAVTRWLARPDLGTSRLVHGDFDGSHLFVDAAERRYTGLIDFGEIRGADPEYDLGHALLWGESPGTPFRWRDLAVGYGLGRQGGASVMGAIRDQALAIGVRQLAVFHARASPAERALRQRLTRLLAPDEAAASEAAGECRDHPPARGGSGLDASESVTP